MKVCIVHLVLIALLEPLSWAGYTDFLGRNDIQVIQENTGSTKSSAKVFPGGHDEKYWAIDSDGAHYKLRIQDELPEYAEIGVSMILDQVGLPNLPVYPILLEREKQGVPSAEEAKKLDGLFGRSGIGKELFPATLQPAVHLKPFSMDQLNEKQLAELLGHLVVNAVAGNHDFGLTPEGSGNLGFDGKHFYTLDSTQSFKFYSHESDSIGDILRGNFSSLLPSFINQVRAKDPKIFAKILNTYLTRLESLTNEDTSTLDFYFQGVNDLRKSKGQESFDYRNKLKKRLHEIRASVLQFLKEEGLKEADLNELSVPDPKVSKIHLTLPQSPKDFRNSKPEDFLWTYYFRRSHQYRSNAIKEWAKELNIPETEIIPSIINRTDPIHSPKGFKLGEEFPNYFFQPSHSPEEMKQAIVQALGSIVARLDFPFEKGGKIQNTGFIENLISSAKELDPNVKVYFSGGVVRSLLGYLYQKIYQEKKKYPEEGTLEILHRITKDNQTLKKTKPKERIQVLGIGSDLDVLIDPSPGLPSTTLEEIKSRVLSQIDSVRRNLGLQESKNELITSLVPYGDVNLYDEQIHRSISNGGSTMDFLAFDLETNQIREPKQLSTSVLSNFLKGRYDFLPLSPEADLDEKTVRGLRTLVEIPFLKLTDSGREIVISQLEKMLRTVEEGKPLSDRALKQFEKLARNARFGGAHNRIFFSSEPIEELARELILRLGKREKNLPLLPKYILQSDPKRRKFRDLPHRLLLDPTVFEEKYTAGGYLYHGTPLIAHLLSMVRNGIVLSGLGQGGAAFGPGAYTTSDYFTAAGYSGKDGIVIPIKIKNGVHPRILNWPDVRDSSEMKAIVNKAKSLNKEPFQYLAEEYGIDIIVNGYVLIQNSAVLSLPKDFGDLTRIQSLILAQLLRTDLVPDQDAFDRISPLLAEYKSIYQLGKSMNYTGLPSPKEALENMLKDPLINPSAAAFNPSRDERTLRERILQSLQPSNPVVVRRIGAALISDLPEQDKKADIFSLASADKDRAVLGLSVAGLSSCETPEMAHLIKKCFETSVERIGIEAAKKFPLCSGTFAEDIFDAFIRQDWKYAAVLEEMIEEMVKKNDSQMGQILSKYLSSTDPKILKRVAMAIVRYTGPHRSALLKQAFYSPLNQTPMMNKNSGKYELNYIRNIVIYLPPEALQKEDFEWIQFCLTNTNHNHGLMSLDNYLMKFPQPPREDIDQLLKKMMLEGGDSEFNRVLIILEGNYLSNIEDQLLAAAFAQAKEPGDASDKDLIRGRAADVLKSLLLKTERHRLMAARALYAYPEEDLSVLFAQTLSDPSQEVWQAAQNSLTRLPEESQEKVIRSLLDHSNPLVQERARLALQNTKLIPSINVLLDRTMGLSRPPLANPNQCSPQSPAGAGH